MYIYIGIHVIYNCNKRIISLYSPLIIECQKKELEIDYCEARLHFKNGKKLSIYRVNYYIGYNRIIMLTYVYYVHI